MHGRIFVAEGSRVYDVNIHSAEEMNFAFDTNVRYCEFVLRKMCFVVNKKVKSMGTDIKHVNTSSNDVSILIL